MMPKKLILLITDSSSTMTNEDWDRLRNATAATVDGRVHIPLYNNRPPPELDLIQRPEKREKEYWKPKYERFKKKHQ